MNSMCMGKTMEKVRDTLEGKNPERHEESKNETTREPYTTISKPKGEEMFRMRCGSKTSLNTHY